MAVPEQIRKHWIEIQKRYDYPVNAIGVRIDPRDTTTMNVWRSEGIDQFRKDSTKPEAKSDSKSAPPPSAAPNPPKTPSSQEPTPT